MKNKIACYIPNSKLGYRDINNSNIISMLTEGFDVKFIVSEGLRLGIEDKKYENLTISTSRFRFHIWSILFELSNYLYYKNKLNTFQAFPLLGMSMFKRFFIKSLIYLNLQKIFNSIFSFYIKITSPNYEYYLKNTDVLIAFSSSKDLLLDDLIRSSNKTQTKVVLVLINWDNATSKPYLEFPDLILTWGSQTANLSKKIHKINSLAIGSPRFEIYKSQGNFCIDDIKLKYQMDLELNYILYAGASFPSHDISILNMLSSLIVKNYNSKYRIIYRPHPNAWYSKQSKKNLDFRKIVIDDPIKDYEDNLFLKFRHLHKLSCALISPYSTMAIESLINENPVMLIGIDYNKFFLWKHNSLIAPHLKILKNKNFVIHCHDIDSVEKNFEKLIALIDNKSEKIKCKELANKIVKLSNRSYEDLLYENLNNFIKNKIC